MSRGGGERRREARWGKPRVGVGAGAEPGRGPSQPHPAPPSTPLKSNAECATEVSPPTFDLCFASTDYFKKPAQFLYHNIAVLVK